MLKELFTPHRYKVRWNDCGRTKIALFILSPSSIGPMLSGLGIVKMQAVDISTFAHGKYKALNSTGQFYDCDDNPNQGSVQRFSFSSSQRQKCAHVNDILQSFKDRDEVKQIIVCGVVNPAFDRNGVICIDVVSLGQRVESFAITASTFVKDVAQRTIVQDHNPAQVWFHGAEIFDVCTVPIRAVLAIVTC